MPITRTGASQTNGQNDLIMCGLLKGVATGFGDLGARTAKQRGSMKSARLTSSISTGIMTANGRLQRQLRH